MSHHQKIRFQFREREHLVQALRELNYDVREGENLKVRTDQDQLTVVDIVVRTGSDYDIGFCFNGHEYEAVANWSRIEHETPFVQREFAAEVRFQYTQNLIRRYALDRGWTVTEDRRLDNGDTVISLTERPDGHFARLLRRPFMKSMPEAGGSEQESLRTIKDTLHTDGTHTLEVINAVGVECIAFSRDLEYRLGTALGRRKYKSKAIGHNVPRSVRQSGREYDDSDEVEAEVDTGVG